jgi:Cu(I)/Ag(I) efflux system membrane fusion protein
MKTKWFILPGCILISFAAGYGFRAPTSHHQHGVIEAGGNEANIRFFTCSMHPNIQQPSQGSCPQCGMDLIPVREGEGPAVGARQIHLSERARQLAEVATSPVERKHVETELRMLGRVTFDETRLSHVTTRVAGRLDRLFVDYTGVKVNQGDHLVTLYSPDLLEAQEELLTTQSTIHQLGSSVTPYLRQSALESFQAAREKLLLWGLSETQVASVLERGSAEDHITLHSPSQGVVVQKDAMEGMYVQTGSKIYTIADLSHLWVELEAYESDLPWLHYGQSVRFTSEAFPGETFEGQIAFIDPVLDARTRTVRVRVNLINTESKLKPDMFVRAIVRAKIAKGGQVMDPGLAGKWISPMHPEIIKDEPGSCDICGMDLVSAQSLGYAEATQDTAPLVIPASAPLITGKRAVVYLDMGDGIYEGRDIILGPRAGDHYLVERGLKEGDRVVTRGNFKIDSAIQILAKPSMMNPGEDSLSALPIFKASDAFLDQLNLVTEAYLPVQHALSHDATEGLDALVGILHATIDALPSPSTEEEQLSSWHSLQASLHKAASEMTDSSSDIAKVRESFSPLSRALSQVLAQWGSSFSSELYLLHCPMAFKGQGADWIQTHQAVENPYFGDRMFACGEVKETLHQSH